MKIGIDGKHISNLQKGGFKTYSVSLVKNMAKLDMENEYFVYFDRPVSSDIFPRQKNFHYRIIKATNLLGTVLREQFFLGRIIQKDKLDLFHFPANTGSINFPIKYILTLHDAIEFLPEEKLRFKYKIEGTKQSLLNRYNKFVIPKVVNKARQIITISENSKNEISDLFGINKDKIAVTHPGLKDNFKIQSTSKIKKRFNLKNKYILALGSVDLRKNIVTLLEAFSKLDNLDIQLVIVSSHPNISKYLKQKSDIYGISEKVRILDNVGDEDLKDLFSEATVFVFPSYYEGFGLPVLEAMALGTPVICSKTSSIAEVGGGAVRYINPSNSQEIKNAIYDCLTNDTLAQEMRTNGKLQAQKFSWEKCARETLKVYEEVYKGN